MGQTGKVISVNISESTGEKKRPVESIELIVEVGVKGDGHAGKDPKRQISLLAEESIEKIRAEGIEANPGDFAENITTRGIVLHELPPGTKLTCGEALLEVTRIGKECHDRCAIYRQVGDCVMPREGIFARAVQGGTVRPGDELEVL